MSLRLTILDFLWFFSVIPDKCQCST